MTNVYIIRHGNTFDKGDLVTRVGARTDLPLSKSGNQQAFYLGEHFKKKNIQFTAAYCSPLVRTQETLEEILKCQDHTTRPQVMDFLREIDYGPDENKSEEIVQERIGQEALDNWEKHAIPPSGWIIDIDYLKSEWLKFFETGFESENIAVVTSNGIARFALMVCQHRQSHSLKLKTGAYGIVKVEQGSEPEILEWNVRP